MCADISLKSTQRFIDAGRLTRRILGSTTTRFTNIHKNLAQLVSDVSTTPQSSNTGFQGRGSFKQSLHRGITSLHRHANILKVTTHMSSQTRIIFLRVIKLTRRVRKRDMCGAGRGWRRNWRAPRWAQALLTYMVMLSDGPTSITKGLPTWHLAY